MNAMSRPETLAMASAGWPPARPTHSPVADQLERLLNMPGIGPKLLERLRAAGIDSLSQLRAMGVESALRAMAGGQAPDVYANRRRFLERALAELA